jgi:hypothetical protein
MGALRLSKPLGTLVRAGNIVDVSAANFEQFKSQIQTSDTPEIVLLPEAFSLQPFGTNSQVASLSQTFQLVLTQDSLRSGILNAVKFAAMLALLQAGPDLGLGGLIRSWEIRQGKDDPFGQTQWRRGTQRFVSVMSILVNMELDRSQLLSM